MKNCGQELSTASGILPFKYANIADMAWT